MAVLDLACGHGRIANRLAARGCQVSGLDASTLFLPRARQDAGTRGVAVDYHHGDMRALPFQAATFDRVLCVFTSFGYFDDDGNRRVLAEAGRVLRPGGRLYVDQYHLLGMVGDWQEALVTERDGHWMIDRRRFDAEHGRTVNERTIIRDGLARTARYFVRTLTGPEWRAWLADAGFGAVALHGDRGDELTMRSRRIVAVATR